MDLSSTVAPPDIRVDDAYDLPVRTELRTQAGAWTTVPEPLERFLQGHGFAVSWQLDNSEDRMVLHRLGIRPVTRAFLEGLGPPDELREMMAGSGDMGFGTIPFNADGLVKLSDSILCVQTIEAREDYFAMVDEMRARREDARAFVADVDDRMAALYREAANRDPGESLLRGSIARTSEAVRVSKRTNEAPGKHGKVEIT